MKNEEEPIAVEAVTLDGETVMALIRGENTVISDNEASVRLYAWKQVYKYGDPEPGYSEPVRLGGLWHSGPWEPDGLCALCGGRVAVLTERSGWTVPYCCRGGLHRSLSLEDHQAIARNRKRS